MRAELMEILVCPVCHGELTLEIEQIETEPAGADEVVSGSLHCAACNHTYRIEGGIPDLLPPALSAPSQSEGGSA